MRKSNFIRVIKQFADKAYSHATINSMLKNSGVSMPSWYYSSTDVAWCDLTVSTALIKACEDATDKALIKKMGYPQATINTQKCRKLGYFHYTKDGYTPKKGDLLLFRWNLANDDNFDHIGVAYKDAANGVVTTIEGNASSDQKVHYYKRNTKYVKAIIRIPWETEIAAKKKEYLSQTGTNNKKTVRAMCLLLKAFGYNVEISATEKSDMVKAWQKHLKKWGYYTKDIDGKVGKYSVQATLKLLKKMKFYSGETKLGTKMDVEAWKALQRYLNYHIKKGTFTL